MIIRKDAIAATICARTKIESSTNMPSQLVTIQPSPRTKAAAIPNDMRISHEMQVKIK